MVLVDGSKAAFTLQVLKLNLELLRFDFFFFACLLILSLNVTSLK